MLTWPLVHLLVSYGEVPHVLLLLLLKVAVGRTERLFSPFLGRVLGLALAGLDAVLLHGGGTIDLTGKTITIYKKK